MKSWRRTLNVNDTLARLELRPSPDQALNLLDTPTGRLNQPRSGRRQDRKRGEE